MRCLTWTPLSILGGPYFFFSQFHCFHLTLESKKIFILAAY